MPRCRTVQSRLTAWVDGELSERSRERVSNHIARCPGCAGEAERLRRAVAWQEASIQRLLAGADVDRGAMLANVRRAVAAEPRQTARARSWQLPRWWELVWHPALLAGLASVVVVVAGVRTLGGPENVLVPLGIKDPPPRVSRTPELFREYRVIKRLELLENFDTVETEPLFEKAQAGQG